MPYSATPWDQSQISISNRMLLSFFSSLMIFSSICVLTRYNSVRSISLSLPFSHSARQRVERAVQVLNERIRVFQPHRNAHQSLRDSFKLQHLPVRVQARRVYDAFKAAPARPLLKTSRDFTIAWMASLSASGTKLIRPLYPVICV